MKSCFKRIVALLTIFTVVAGMLYCINVSAASDIWAAVKGSPTFADIEDGYTNISVSVDKAVITKQKHNFEDNAIYIEDFDIPKDGGKWVAFTFSSETKDTADRHLSVKPVSSYNRLPSQGFLSLLVRVKNSTKLQFFVLNESGAEELSTNIDYRDDLYIRFVKTNSGYAIEANGKVLTHKNIKEFCNGGYQKDSYLIIHSQNQSSYMKGNVKIAAKNKPIWSALAGMPLIEDLEDNSTDVYVAQGRSAVTNKKYNLEEKSIYIDNFNIPEGKGGPWAAITFTSDKKSVRVMPKADGDYLASKGFLPVLIRVNQSDKTKYQLFVLNEKGEEQIRVSINRSENLYIRFVKTNTGYALQVNEKNITHQFITDYCEGGFHKNSYVIFHSESSYKDENNKDVGTYMKGNVTIEAPTWNVSNEYKIPVVYKSDYNTYSVASTEDNSYTYAVETIDFDSQALLFKKINIQDAKTISLNLSNTVNGADKTQLNIVAIDDIFKIYLDDTSLGDVPKSYSVKIAVVKKDDKYTFVVNGKVLDCGNKLKNLFNDNREVYASVIANGKFNTDIIFEELSWLAFSGEPVISLSENKSSHIEVETDEVAIAPYRYDVLTTGVSVSNLQISDSDGTLVYFGKTFEAIGQNASVDGGITLLLEKGDEGIDISLYKNRYGKKGYLGTVAESDKYEISFYWNQRTRTLKVNNTEFKFSKLTDKQSITAAKDIEEFLGTEEENLVYIAFSSIGSAKADLDLFYFVKPDQPFGVAIHTPRNVFTANGNDSTGYAAKTSEETYLVTIPAWDFRSYQLEVDFKTVNGPVYLAVSKTGVSDEKFWPTGKGDKINRTGFVITPQANNTKAQIAYYGADGKATETVITTIDFNWNSRHAYRIGKADDSNWYLYIDDVAMDQAISPVLNAFMESVGKNDLYFILGSKKGFYVERFRFKKITLTAAPEVPPETDDDTSSQVDAGFKALYKKSGVFYRVDLEKAQDNQYIFPSDKACYAVRNTAADVRKTAFQVKFNSLAKLGTATPYVVFGLSNTGIDGEETKNTSFDESNTERFILRFTVNVSSNSFTIKHRYGSSSDVVLKTFDDFDFTTIHTFDFRLVSGQWYLFVDGEMVEGSNINELQTFMAANNTEELLYCLGTNGKLNADCIDVIEKEDDSQDEIEEDNTVYEDTFIDPNVETWHFYSTSRGTLEGNDIDGYHIDNYKNTWAYTDYKYDHKKTALSVKFSSTLVGEWGYFALCTSDYTDENKTPKGDGDKVNRVVLLMVPRGDSAEFQYWCINGTDAKATVIGTYAFDWNAKHTFDVRQSEDDGNWYFCVDGKLLISRVSKTLNLFMKTHNDENLRYCYGAKDCLGIESAKVVLKPALVKDKNTEHGYEDGDFVESEDFGFEFDFDNQDEEIEFEPEFESEEIEIDPLDYLNKVKVKKRRLVSAAHGIIFTKLEIAGMIAGGVAVLAGIAFLVIFLIKRNKAKKKAK